jgi:hypothetical protein
MEERLGFIQVHFFHMDYCILDLNFIFFFFFFEILKVRLKRHRWYRKILKSNDPLVFSLGWRRFQSLPIYSIQDQNNRNRLVSFNSSLKCQLTESEILFLFILLEC